MKNYTKTLVAAFAVALLSCSVAQAVQITGGISLGGGPITTNTGNLNAATSILGFGTVITTGGTGTYAGVPIGTSVPTTTGFQFLPILVPNPVVDVWRFTFMGVTYSFNLTAIQTVNQGFDVNGNQFLDISGTGILFATGFDATPGTYIFTANSSSGTFSFSSSNGAQGPEGGSALALLGLGLVAVEALRRKLVTS